MANDDRVLTDDDILKLFEASAKAQKAITEGMLTLSKQITAITDIIYNLVVEKGVGQPTIN